MKITLISKETFNEVFKIYSDYPALTFQNKGYQYLDKSKFNEDEKKAFNQIEEVLTKHIFDFVEFNNFNLSEEGIIRLRFQYHYDPSFTGVGYINLDELLNGFEDE